MAAVCRLASCWTLKLKPLDAGDCSISGFQTASLRPPGRAVAHAVRAKAIGQHESPFWRRLTSIAPMNPFLSADRLDSSAVSRGSRMSIAASSSGEIQAAVSSSSSVEELKEKLLVALQAGEGISDETESIITELVKRNPNVGVLEGGAAGVRLWEGAFENIKASFKDQDVCRGSPVTLGRLSFNSFKPTDVDAFVDNVVHVVDREPEGKSVYVTTFTFDNPRGPDLPSVDGIVFTTASFKNVGPDRQELAFESCVVRPRFPERDLEVWKELFAENHGMDEKGQVSATLPGYKGSLDYLYIDEELRITKGTLGSYVVVRKLPAVKPEFRV